MKNFTSTYNRTPIMCSIDRRTGSGVQKGIKPRLYCQIYLQCSEINLQSNNSRELPMWDCTSPWSIDSQIHSLYFPSSTSGERYPRNPRGHPGTPDEELTPLQVAFLSLFCSTIFYMDLSNGRHWLDIGEQGKTIVFFSLSFGVHDCSSLCRSLPWF